MSRDDTKLNYYSGWDIDQLVSSTTMNVGIGTTAVYTIPTTLPSRPVFEILFIRTGFTRYYQPGRYSPNGTLASSKAFSSYQNGNQIFITVAETGTAKVLIYSDRYDY